MKPGFRVSKCAIISDPRDSGRTQSIKAAMAQLLPELERVGIAAETYVKVPVEDIRPGSGVDLFIVLGGDGTMINYAGQLASHGIPFYGLNYGNVGFMMNSPMDGLAQHADSIKAGNFGIWEFPVLKVVARDNKGEVHKGLGLNDIYLQRMTPQSCKVNVTINGSPLTINPLLCDGIIVATPLGSTAYSYNVTGAMVAIDTPVLTLTPVAANRSCPVKCMILPLDTTICFDILEPQKRRVQVVADSQSHGDLTHAEISVSQRRVQLCFGSKDSHNLPMRFINKATSG